MPPGEVGDRWQQALWGISPGVALILMDLALGTCFDCFFPVFFLTLATMLASGPFTGFFPVRGVRVPCVRLQLVRSYLERYL